LSRGNKHDDARQEALTAPADAGERLERHLRPLRPPLPVRVSLFVSCLEERPDLRVAVTPSGASAGLLDELANLGPGHQPLTGAGADFDHPCSLVLGEAATDQLGEAVRDLLVNWFLGHDWNFISRARAPSKRPSPRFASSLRHVAAAAAMWRTHVSEGREGSKPHPVRVCARMWRMWRM